MSSMWPSLAGGVSAIVIYLVGAALIERRRIRHRRLALKGRLFK
jgi:hypothetical protein